MTGPPAQDTDDAAWITIETPFNSASLRSFLDDVERLYRINPMLEFDEWRQDDKNRFRLRAKNLSNGRQLETFLTVDNTEDGLMVRYSDGLRRSTCFRIEERPDGNANLIVTDDYSGTSIEEREARIDEVDKSLAQWGQALHQYMHRWKRWSRVPGWQYYMRRIWQPMKPMARRITFILIVLAAAEFVVFLFFFTIFALELHKYID
ncbi:MAG: hypothetical protein V3R51_05985 [Gammaproteobacteria bacterium]